MQDVDDHSKVVKRGSGKFPWGTRAEHRIDLTNKDHLEKIRKESYFLANAEDAGETIRALLDEIIRLHLAIDLDREARTNGNPSIYPTHK